MRSPLERKRDSAGSSSEVQQSATPATNLSPAVFTEAFTASLRDVSIVLGAFVAIVLVVLVVFAKTAITTAADYVAVISPVVGAITTVAGAAFGVAQGARAGATAGQGAAAAAGAALESSGEAISANKAARQASEGQLGTLRSTVNGVLPLIDEALASVDNAHRSLSAFDSPVGTREVRGWAAPMDLLEHIEDSSQQIDYSKLVRVDLDPQQLQVAAQQLHQIRGMLTGIAAS